MRGLTIYREGLILLAQLSKDPMRKSDKTTASLIVNRSSSFVVFFSFYSFMS